MASGVKIDARDKDGQTPLHYVGTAEIAKVLLQAGAKVNTRSENGETPLHIAAKKENATNDPAKVAKVLLKAGANAKAKNKNGKTPFEVAKRGGRLKGTDAYWLLNDAQYD